MCWWSWFDSPFLPPSSFDGNLGDISRRVWTEGRGRCGGASQSKRWFDGTVCHEGKASDRREECAEDQLALIYCTGSLSLRAFRAARIVLLDWDSPVLSWLDGCMSVVYCKSDVVLAVQRGIYIRKIYCTRGALR